MKQTQVQLSYWTRLTRTNSIFDLVSLISERMISYRTRSSCCHRHRWCYHWRRSPIGQRAFDRMFEPFWSRKWTNSFHYLVVCSKVFFNWKKWNKIIENYQIWHILLKFKGKCFNDLLVFYLNLNETFGKS